MKAVNKSRGMIEMITVRKFGVELEGYTDTCIRDESIPIQGRWFEAESDGSLSDKEQGDCEKCDGVGTISESCDNCSGSGEVEFTDDAGNEYTFDCKECNGEGDSDHECDDCEGTGRDDASEAYEVEVKSPPITDTSLIHGIYDYLDDNGWQVDSDCGLHIHVDAEDYTSRDMQKLLLLMTMVEPVIYSITDQYRYVSGYSYPLWKEERKVLQALEAEEYVPHSEVMFTGNRYYALNFNAYFRHGTVEFRHFAPQTDANKVIKYVELVTKLVDFAKGATMDQVKVIVIKAYGEPFSIVASMIEEILSLSYSLSAIKENNRFEQYPVIDGIENYILQTTMNLSEEAV